MMANRMVRMVLMWAVVAALLGVAGVARAQEAGADADQTEKPAKRDENKPARFVPPSRGAPESRIGGGVRGGEGELMFVALVPRQLALTTQAQPTLYWYLDRAVEAPLQLSITRLDTYDTIYQKEIAPVAAGLGSHKLGGDLELQPALQYEWTITLVTSPDNPSQNPVTGGWLTRVEAGDELKAQLEGKGAAEQVGEYARRGIWYEALHALASALAANPGDDRLLALRAALLSDENVGLKDVAEALAR